MVFRNEFTDVKNTLSQVLWKCIDNMTLANYTEVCMQIGFGNDWTRNVIFFFRTYRCGTSNWLLKSCPSWLHWTAAKTDASATFHSFKASKTTLSSLSRNKQYSNIILFLHHYHLTNMAYFIYVLWLLGINSNWNTKILIIC